MNKHLQAFELAQIDRNRRESEPLRRSSRQWAETAPVPSDLMICRWCQRALIVLGDTAESLYCQSGCSQTVLFERWCSECRKKFETGNVRADTCYGCDQKCRARYAEGPRGAQSGTFKSYRRGDVNRRA